MLNCSDLHRQAQFVHGRELAYRLRNRTAAQRAVIAARYDLSALTLIYPTGKQWAAINKIPTHYLLAARALPPNEQQRVLSELRALIEPEDRLKTAIRAIGTDAAFDVLCQAL